MLIVLNFTTEPRILRLPALGQGALAVSTHPGRESRVDLTALQLQANEGCVIVLEHAAGLTTAGATA